MALFHWKHSALLLKRSQFLTQAERSKVQTWQTRQTRHDNNFSPLVWATMIWTIKQQERSGKYYTTEYFFRSYITSSKHDRGSKNSTQLRKPLTESRVCITFEILRNPQVYRWGYVTTENVLCCFEKIFLKNKRESRTSQPCLHTLI